MEDLSYFTNWGIARHEKTRFFVIIVTFFCKKAAFLRIVRILSRNDIRSLCEGFLRLNIGFILCVHYCLKLAFREPLLTKEQYFRALINCSQWSHRNTSEVVQQVISGEFQKHGLHIPQTSRPHRRIANGQKQQWWLRLCPIRDRSALAAPSPRGTDIRRDPRRIGLQQPIRELIHLGAAFGIMPEGQCIRIRQKWITGDKLYGHEQFAFRAILDSRTEPSVSHMHRRQP